MAETKKIDDGGYAFPNGPDHKSGWDAEYGMSLRDYFAGQALIGLCQADMSEEEYTVSPHMLARTAYSMADAMIAARGGRYPRVYNARRPSAGNLTHALQGVGAGA